MLVNEYDDSQSVCVCVKQSVWNFYSSGICDHHVRKISGDYFR